MRYSAESDGIRWTSNGPILTGFWFISVLPYALPGSDATTAAEAHVLASTCLGILDRFRFVGLPVEVLRSFVHLLGFCLNGFCL